jgi:transposase
MQEMVRKAFVRDGKSKRQIARDPGIHRETVTRLLARAPGVLAQYPRRTANKSPVTGPYLGVIEAWLKADEQAPRKQRHTAQRIYDRLVAEYQELRSGMKNCIGLDDA